MKKISELIQINSGYTSYVDLYEDYYDLEKNRGRMERYKPIRAHRRVFEKIANALNPLDRRFYFLSGSYGTGKSHLLLMLANYFACPSDVEEIKRFFENYETAQDEVLLKPGETLDERSARSLQEARKSGRFLVVVCRYSLNLDFEGALLRALEDSLKKDETGILLDTHYGEALRRIKNWESRRNEERFYAHFEAALANQHPDWTINNLLSGLEKYDETALIVFKECFKTVTDSDFSYNKDNLRDIISDFFANPEFKQRYEGIVFLYDEFGAAIDKGLVDYSILLDFAQFCANSTLEKGGTVIFIGTGHKGFRNHGQIGDLNAETLEARVSEIGLETQGMEDIISAIVQPNKDNPLWKDHVQTNSHKFTWFSSECNRLRLFNWLPAPKIKNNIIENIYPMHPLATFALLELAKVAGSDNRSVFKFFAPEFETGESGWKNVQFASYPWFLENHEIIENKKLTLYTPDLLVDYFQNSLKASNTRLNENAKTSVANYEATLRELNAYLAKESEQQLFDEVDELMEKIIKAMLVNDLISKEDIAVPNTAQNIKFALDAVSQDEKKLVENRLEILSNQSVRVIFNDNGVYQLMRSDRIDVQGIVDKYKANPDNRPVNLLESFLDFVPLRGNDQYLEAKEYNQPYGEDKRLKVHFITPSVLDEKFSVNNTKVSFFDYIEYERKQTSGGNGYEGSAVFVFCENDGDINAAKKKVAKNHYQRIAVAIPRSPISVYDHIFTLNALGSDVFKKQAENFSPLERATEKQIRDDAVEALNEARSSYFSNKRVHWFGKNAVEIPVKENDRFDVATKMMLDLFGSKRNTFPHTDFNKTNINISGKTFSVLKEAADILCDTTQNIRINWSWPENRGGTKYLRRCFVDRQALKYLHSEGDIRIFEPERNLNKFRSAMPAYAKLLEELASLENKGAVNFTQFLEPFFDEYGQGELAITLMMLLARRYYGDSLRFKLEPGNLTDYQISNGQDMLDLIQGRNPLAVVIFESVSDKDKEYFAKIAQLFSNQPVQAGKVYTISEAYQAITVWWDGLPLISRSLTFYDEENRSFAELLSTAKTKDPFRFIKYDLLEILDITPGEILTDKSIMKIEVRLKAFKAKGEAIEASVGSRILQGVAEIFGAESHLDVDIQEAMRNWYSNLSTTQTDPIGTFHNNDSKPLVKHTSYAKIRELLFDILPDAYTLGAVKTWMSDYVSTYLERIRSGKEHIETNAPQISQLIVQFKGNHKEQGNQVVYQNELTLHAETEDGEGIIYYTADGSDPKSSRSRQRLSTGDNFTIKGNPQVKLVVADEMGNYGAVRTIQAIDELEKFSIKRPAQRPAFDETITFVFPNTKDEARKTVSSFINEIGEAKIFSKSELKKLIDDLLEELKF